jgi:osmoprotectant transport system ATP-binding protein
VIRFERVSRHFSRPDGGTVAAVADLDLAVRRGETLCLIGGSGSGKTTALRLSNRLLEPSGGRVLVEDRDVAGVDPVGLRRRMGYVVQRGALFPHLTVAANVGLLCRVEGLPRAHEAARVNELLELVRLDPGEFGARYPAELSGGQRQRVGVARALALDPPMLLLDEPFGALDPITRRELQDEFLALCRGGARTVVLVTHDLEEAFRLGDRVALMHAGRLLQVGTPDDLRQRPRDALVEAYLADQAGGVS